jgi:hypothetical protein
VGITQKINLFVATGPKIATGAFEASKWRRYRLRVAAADGGSIRKAARKRDRSHFDVPSGFDRFCPWLRQRALEYTHMPASRFLALNKIASNLERASGNF